MHKGVIQKLRWQYFEAFDPRPFVRPVYSISLCINVDIYRARNNYWRVPLKYYQNFNTEATETCNAVLEWKFCELSEYVQFNKIKLLIKSTKIFLCDQVDFAHAHPNSNL